MTKYEYKQFTVKTKGTVSMKMSDEFITQLNKFGRDGWKLTEAIPIAMGYGRTSVVTFIMRKETTL